MNTNSKEILGLFMSLSLPLILVYLQHLTLHYRRMDQMK